MKPTRLPNTLGLRFLGLLLLATVLATPLAAQPPGDADRVTAERFLQVLRRRPRAGTALDRVIEYHVAEESLDDLLQTLTAEAPADDAAARLTVAGLIQARRGQAAAAAGAFERAESIDPADASISFELGKSLLAVGKTEQAAAALQRAIDRGPDRLQAADVFSTLARIYARAGQTDRAIEVWGGLESMFPGDVRVGGRIAAALAADGESDEARRRYLSLAKSAKSGDDQINFAVRAAELLRDLGQADEATTELETVMARLRPGSYLYDDVQRRLESGFLAAGDYDALAQYYRRRIETNPDDVAMQTRLGGVLMTAGRLDEAQTVLKNLLERSPDDPAITSSLIDVQISRGDYAAAADQYRNLLRADSNNADYALALAQTLLADTDRPEADRRSDAVEVWQKLVDARPDDAVLIAQVADLMRGIDRTDTAIDLYRRAIAVDPSSPQYREYLGQYLFKLNRRDEAMNVWQSIAEGDRRDRDSLVRLAEVYRTFDLDDRSLQTWRAAAEYDLDFDTRLRYAAALSTAGDHDDAIVVLEAAQSLADAPETRDRLLTARIKAFQSAGTLRDQIQSAAAEPATPDSLRRLAVMLQADNQNVRAAEVIADAATLAPGDVAILSVAADIAQRQNQFLLAAERYEELADVDRRYQTNHLKNAASLRIRLGQADQAMRLADRVVQANPASPQSYAFLARTASQVGRADAAEEALRRAVQVAPRDPAPLRSLASELADRYRTEEAIRLHWQAMTLHREVEDRLATVRDLAPLYVRQDELESLIERLQDPAAVDAPAVRGKPAPADPRTTGLMVAAAYEAVQYFGQAIARVEQLLAKSPRDVGLLQTVVRLADDADDTMTAAEYARRLTQVSDTPENRTRLAMLELDAGLIDVGEALSRRISIANDPSRLGAMIRGAASRGDKTAVMQTCRVVLDRSPELWDVRLYLAEMLAHEFYQTPSTGTEEEIEARQTLRQELLATLRQVRDAEVEPDDPPPTGSASRRPQSVTHNSWVGRTYDIARAYRLGQYGRYYYGNQSSISLVTPLNYAHGKAIAGALILKTEADHPVDPTSQTVEFWTALSGDFSTPPPEDVDQPAKIWEDIYLRDFSKAFVDAPEIFKVVINEQQTNQTAYKWRLLQLDPAGGAGPIVGALRFRFNQVHDDDPKTQPTAFDRPEIDQLQQLLAEHHRLLSQPAPAQRLSHDAYLQNEYQLAGAIEKAQSFDLQLHGDADPALILHAIDLHQQMHQPERADDLMPRLLASARNDDGNPSSGVLRSVNVSQDHIRDFFDRHRLSLLDVVVAAAAARVEAAASQSPTPGSGEFQSYVSLIPGQSSIQVMVKQPIDPMMIPNGLIDDLAKLVPVDSWQKGQRQQPIRVTDAMRQSLTESLTDATATETKMRAVLAAYSRWWTDDAAACYAAILKLADQYPGDIDLTIERARLAAELSQPAEALAMLDSFEPLDSRMLVRKEMAAMNLAGVVGDRQRAAKAAERLFGLRMDRDTQLSLADQMRRLNMNDLADAILRRARGGRTPDISTQLRIAQLFVAGEDKEAAAEVAYTVLQKLSSGRSESNRDYYERQAVSLLRQAGRLDNLLQSAERRLEQTPGSIRLRNQLASLYIAAGRQDDAAKLWMSAELQGRQSPEQMMAQAKAIVRTDASAALDLYLKAIAQNPSLLDREIYQVRTAAQQCNGFDRMYETLSGIDLSRVATYRYDELLRLDYRRRGSGFSDAQRKFAEHMATSVRDPGGRANALRAIPVDELAKSEVLRQFAADMICSPEAFATDSELWQANSYSGDGKLNGVLGQLIALTEVPEIRKRFDDVAQKMLADLETRATARLIGGLVQLQVRESVDSVDEDLLSLAEQINNEQPPRATEEDGLPINPSLARLAAQLVEVDNHLTHHDQIAVGLYQFASERAANQRNQWTHSAGPRYLQALGRVGQKLKARRLAWAAYDAIDHSEQSAYNPGYGESQDLEDKKAVADLLREMGYAIDSEMILRSALADPETFAKAERWGNRSQQESFQKELDETRKLINSKAAHLYLSAVADQLPEPNVDDRHAGLTRLTFQATITDPQPSGIDLAVETLRQSEPEVLKQTYDTILESAADEVDEVARPTSAVLTLLAAAVDAPQAAEHLKCFIELLPPLPTVGGARIDPSTQSAIVDALILHRRVAGQLDTQPLEDFLTTAAEALAMPSLTMAIAGSGDDGGAAVEAYLEQLAKTIRPGVQPPRDQIETLLSMSETLAQNGRVASSARAMALALSGGPPLATVGNVDAFAISSSASSGNDDTGNDLSLLKSRLIKIITSWEKSLGQSLLRWPEVKPIARVQSTSWMQTAFNLFTTAPKESETGTATIAQSDQPAVYAQICDSLQSIVMPPATEAVVHGYAIDTVDPRSYDNSRFGADSVPTSLAIALARSAARCERLDAVTGLAQTRAAANPVSIEAAGLCLQLALAGDDPAAVAAAAEALAAAADPVLPDQEPVDVPDSVTSIDSAMQTESYGKSRLINQLLPNLWSITGRPETPDSARRTAGKMMRGLVSLIRSDAWTAQRHRELASILISESIVAAARGDDDELTAMLRREIQNYVLSSRANPDNFDSSLINNLTTLALGLAADGAVKETAPIIQQLVRTENSSIGTQGLSKRIYQYVAGLTGQEQFEYWFRVTLDPKALVDDSSPKAVLMPRTFSTIDGPMPVQSWSPPRKLTELDQRQVVTLSPDVPVTDPWLALLDAAKTSGRLKLVLRRLDELAGQTDDPAALSRLQAARLSVWQQLDPPPAAQDALPVFQEILDRFAAAKEPDSDAPQENGNHEDRSLDLYVMVQAARTGYPATPTIESWTPVRRWAEAHHPQIAAPLASVEMRLRGLPKWDNSDLLSNWSVAANADPDPRATGGTARDPQGRTWIDGGGRGWQLRSDFPIRGDFQLTINVHPIESTKSLLCYGGLKVQTFRSPPPKAKKDAKDAADPPAAMRWQIVTPAGAICRFDNPAYRDNEVNVFGIEVVGDQLSAICNGQTYATLPIDLTDPWASIEVPRASIAVVDQLSFMGEPEIIQTVDLISPTLRGWTRFGGTMSMTDPGLPVDPSPPGDGPANEYLTAMQSGGWTVEPDAVVSYQPNGDERYRYIIEPSQYHKPLADGEVFTAEFLFDDTHEVGLHVASGYLHFSKTETVLNSDTYNSETQMELAADVEFDPTNHVIDGWNEVTIERRGDRVLVRLNGQDLLQGEPQADAIFGFLTVREKPARLRNMKLHGDWPETLPDGFGGEIAAYED